MSDKPRVIFIDDEERIVRSLAMLFKQRYDVLATTNPREVIDAVRRSRVHVVVSDQRMPEVAGVDLLREVRSASPYTMRILLTGYSDLSAIVGSINDGEIFRFVDKPWDPVELTQTIAQAVAIASELFSETALPQAVPTNAAPPVDLLVVDDSEEVFRLVSQVLGKRYRLYWANSLDAASALLEQHSIGVVISDVKVNGMDIGAALKTLKRYAPQLVTVVLAWFHDTRQLIELINQAQIYRFLPKPVRPHMLETAVDAAAARHRQIAAAPVLAKQHVVEAVPEAATAGIGSRILGYFQRLRERARA